MMNAFSSALADELALARERLRSARARRDDEGVMDARERLLDLTEISERVREGLLIPSP